MPRKNARNKLIRHRGLESENWQALSKDAPVVELVNHYWTRFGLPDELRISPLDAGQYGIIITDATLNEVQKQDGEVVRDNEGQPVPVKGGSNGFYIDDNDCEPTLEVIHAVLDAGIRGGHGIALPMDEMYNRGLDRDDRLLENTILRPESLTEGQIKKMKDSGLENLAGQPLTLVQFETIFGEVTDKEFYQFPEHSCEGRVKLLPRFHDAVRTQQTISTTGKGKSPVRIVPFQKDGLYPLVPPNERGLGGNHWDRIHELWYSGRVGEEGRRERKVFILGACDDYSVRYAAEWMKDTGYDVTVFAPGVKGIGTVPKIVTLRNLAENMFVNITWDWPSEFGPEPGNWDDMRQKVIDYDQSVFETDNGFGSWGSFVKSVETYQPWG